MRARVNASFKPEILIFMKNNRSWMQTCFVRVAKVTLVVLTVTALVTAGQVKAADKYWRTDGTSNTWTSSSWGTSSGGPFNVGWTAGDNATFNAVSAVTYVTGTAIGNVTVNANTTVTAAGTLSTGGTISTFTVADGVTLTWPNQTFPTTAGTGFIKAGNGTWDMSSEGGAYPGAFTLNTGTMIVSKKNSFGAGTLNLNGGTIQSSGSSAFATTLLISAATSPSPARAMTLGQWQPALAPRHETSQTTPRAAAAC